MNSHDILACEEALDVERAFRAELDEITGLDHPVERLYREHQEDRAVSDSLAAESATGYLCAGCQGHATHYAPSAFYVLVPRYAMDVRYPWCLNCRDLVLLTAHEALVRMGSTQDYDDVAQEYLCEKAVDDMLAGPLTKRALATFHDDDSYHRLVRVIERSFECDIIGCTRMQAITLCPGHAQEKHQRAVAEQQQAAVRADRAAAVATPAALLATIALPLWLIPDVILAGIIAGFATLVALLVTSTMWVEATEKHRETPDPMDSL